MIVNKKCLRNIPFNSFKTKQNAIIEEGSTIFIKKNMEYIGLELTSRCAASSIRLLCNQLLHCGLHENTESTTVLNNIFQLKWYPFQINLCFKNGTIRPKRHWSEVVVNIVVCLFIYFILSSKINSYQKQIKVISITSEMT